MIQKEFIRNELRYRYPDLTDSIRFPQQSVGRPLLFEANMKKFGTRIVVVSAREINTLRGMGQSEPLFLCIGTPETEILRQFDVCVLPDFEQPGAVLNFIQRLFDRLDDWTQSLRQAAEAGEGVEELLFRAGEMLQNPVVLLDERGHVVAQSDSTTIVPIEVQIGQYNLSESSIETGIVRKLGNADALDALATRLQSGEAAYTLLCAASERPLYASDEIVFESLAGFLRLMLSERAIRLGTQRNRRESAATELFRSLILQDGNEKNALDALHKLGWNDADEYAILAVEPENGDLRPLSADAICDQLESALEGSCAFPLSPVVIAIVKTELSASDVLMLRLRALAALNNLRIGVCEAYQGLTLLPQRLEQAKLALNSAATFGGVAQYADVFESELASQAIATRPKELVCIRSVLALVRYDRTHETNYIETAEQYVKNRFNAVRTAGELFIHRSTFLYRLERIKAQFGLDLDDKNLPLLHLLLSLRIAKEIS